jgi:hypothetical protein
MRRFDRGIWKHPSLPKGSPTSMTTELAGNKTALITGAGRGIGRADQVAAT